MLIFFVMLGCKKKKQNVLFKVIACFNLIIFILSVAGYCMLKQIQTIGNKCGDVYTIAVMKDVQNKLDKNEIFLICIFAINLFYIIVVILDDIVLFVSDPCKRNTTNNVVNVAPNAEANDINNNTQQIGFKVIKQ